MALGQVDCFRRNSEVRCRVPSDLKVKLRRNWDSKQYYKSARVIPDSRKKFAVRFFRSESEFVEYVLTAVCSMSHAEWDEFTADFGNVNLRSF